jgi:hypothetical protein
MYNLHVFSVKKYSSFRIAVVVVVVVAGKGSLKCFEIRMPQVFQDSQVAGNIYASCDTPIGLLFPHSRYLRLLDIFSLRVGKPPSVERETKKKMG